MDYIHSETAEHPCVKRLLPSHNPILELVESSAIYCSLDAQYPAKCTNEARLYVFIWNYLVLLQWPVFIRACYEQRRKLAALFSIRTVKREQCRPNKVCGNRVYPLANRRQRLPQPKLPFDTPTAGKQDNAFFRSFARGYRATASLPARPPAQAPTRYILDRRRPQYERFR